MSRADPLPSQAAIDAYLLDLLRPQLAEGTATLAYLTRLARGAYPTDVLRILSPHELPTAPPDSATQLAAAASVLPIPHPLDFEWRFSPDGCATLAAELDRAGRRLSEPPAMQVALLGTSGLAEVLPTLRPNLTVTLFERRPEACTALAGVPGLVVVEGDVATTHRAFARRFDLVVADPPWYPALTELFVHAAAELLRPDGCLILCVPGLATRPGIEGERTRLTSTALRVGLRPESHATSTIEYESPPFELAALEAAGLPNFDDRWRRGDVLQFRKDPAGETVGPPSVGAVTGIGPAWEEVRIGRGRFRVCVGQPGSGVGLRAAVPNAILDSVSTRDPRRVNVNVWTATNRVYRAGDPAAVLDELERVADGKQPATSLGRQVDQMVRDDLVHLKRFGLQ